MWSANSYAISHHAVAHDSICARHAVAFCSLVFSAITSLQVAASEHAVQMGRRVVEAEEA